MTPMTPAEAEGIAAEVTRMLIGSTSLRAHRVEMTPDDFELVRGADGRYGLEHPLLMRMRQIRMTTWFPEGTGRPGCHGPAVIATSIHGDLVQWPGFKGSYEDRKTHLKGALEQLHRCEGDPPEIRAEIEVTDAEHMTVDRRTGQPKVGDNCNFWVKVRRLDHHLEMREHEAIVCPRVSDGRLHVSDDIDEGAKVHCSGAATLRGWDAGGRKGLPHQVDPVLKLALARMTPVQRRTLVADMGTDGTCEVGRMLVRCFEAKRGTFEAHVRLTDGIHWYIDCLIIKRHRFPDSVVQALPGRMLHEFIQHPIIPEGLNITEIEVNNPRDITIHTDAAPVRFESDGHDFVWRSPYAEHRLRQKGEA